MKIEPLPYLKKRHLLNEPDVDLQRMKKLGDAYIELDLLQDALSFYEKAKDSSGIERILNIAREEGDVFLVKQALKILKRELGREDWIEIGKIAEQKGKFFFALEAYREAGEQDEVGRLSVTTAVLLNESRHSNARSLDTQESDV